MTHVRWARPATAWWTEVLRRLLRQRAAVVSAAIVLLIAALALLAPVVAPYDPTQQFLKDGRTASGQPLPPNAEFLLGTDSLGRDVLSRIIWGARISLGIGIAASILIIAEALLIGGASGFLGGDVDFLAMRFVDLMMSLPTFFIVLLMISMFKPSPWIMILTLALVGWSYPARVFRSQVISLKQRDFVMAARSLGAPNHRIFLRHIMPHLASLVIVYLALSVPTIIFIEAGLSFLGLGIPPPAPSWGGMIQDGQAYYRTAPWLVLFPGVAIILTVICVNVFCAGLNEAMDAMRHGR